MSDEPASEPDDERVQQRAELTAEEETAGSGDPVEQARIILEDSDARQAQAAPDAIVEHRTSDETVEPESD
jgi:hypothetical protein